VDISGALLIVSVPLAATVNGRWDFGRGVCRANAAINIAIWLQVSSDHFPLYSQS